MRLLLDTHALLWWWSDDPQLSPAACALVADPSHEVLVSAASAWEIATKQRIGKLSTWPMPDGGFGVLVESDGFRHLPVSATHAWHAGSLDWALRDPFDGVMAAQTLREGLTLVTRDPVFAALAIPTAW